MGQLLYHKETWRIIQATLGFCGLAVKPRMPQSENEAMNEPRPMKLPQSQE